MPAVGRRLARLARQLAPGGAAAAKERPYAELGASADGPLKLLDDDQMQQFLGAGFLTLPIEELGEEFHDALYDKAKVEFGPDNNGLRGTGGSTERIPELLTMVNSQTVAGALVSILGEDYAHGHLGVSGCALHVSTGEDQIFHKDTQRAVITGHRTRAAMVMYYPGAADVDMGPTAIVPSSHILARDGLGLSLGVTEEGPAAEFDRDDWSGLGAGQADILPAIAPTLAEHKVVVPSSAKGSICIVHEDVRALSGCARQTADPMRSACRWSTAQLRGCRRRRSGGRCSSSPSRGCTSPAAPRGATTQRLRNRLEPNGQAWPRPKLRRSARVCGAGTSGRRERPRPRRRRTRRRWPGWGPW